MINEGRAEVGRIRRAVLLKFVEEGEDPKAEDLVAGVDVEAGPPNLATEELYLLADVGREAEMILRTRVWELRR